MPLFEYECPKCHRVIETVEPFDVTEEHKAKYKCGCRTTMVRREFSVPARVTPGKYGKAGGTVILPPSGEK